MKKKLFKHAGGLSAVKKFVERGGQAIKETSGKVVDEGRGKMASVIEARQRKKAPGVVERVKKASISVRSAVGDEVKKGRDTAGRVAAGSVAAGRAVVGRAAKRVHDVVRPGEGKKDSCVFESLMHPDLPFSEIIERLDEKGRKNREEQVQNSAAVTLQSFFRRQKVKNTIKKEKRFKRHAIAASCGVGLLSSSGVGITMSLTDVAVFSSIAIVSAPVLEMAVIAAACVLTFMAIVYAGKKVADHYAKQKASSEVPTSSVPAMV